MWDCWSNARSIEAALDTYPNKNNASEVRESRAAAAENTCISHNTNDHNIIQQGALLWPRKSQLLTPPIDYVHAAALI